MSAPLGILAIMAGFVSNEAVRTLHYLIEVGPSATLDEVEAVAKAYRAKSARKLAYHEERGFERYAIEEALRGFVQLGVLAHEGERFSLTQAATEHFVEAISAGCNDEEYAASPAWIRALIEGGAS